MNANHYSAQIIWSDEDDGYIATTPELQGVSAFAETPEGALAELAVARSLWLEEIADSGGELPPPLSLDAYSGQFRLRVPRTLHAWLASRAEIEGVSLNTLIVQLLSEGRGARVGFVPRATIESAASRAPRVASARVRADLDVVVDPSSEG